MDVRKIVSMPSELVERISDFRHSQRIATEAEAIRLLIAQGLAAFEAGHQKGNAE